MINAMGNTENIALKIDKSERSYTIFSFIKKVSVDYYDYIISTVDNTTLDRLVLDQGIVNVYLPKTTYSLEDKIEYKTPIDSVSTLFKNLE